MSQVRNELVRMIDRALGPDPREALIAARALQDEVEWLTQKAVALARVNGWGWGTIGRLLRMSRQGARQRFPLAPAKAPPHVVQRIRAEAPHRQGELILARWRAGLPGLPQEDDDPVFW